MMLHEPHTSQQLHPLRFKLHLGYQTDTLTDTLWQKTIKSTLTKKTKQQYNKHYRQDNNVLSEQPYRLTPSLLSTYLEKMSMVMLIRFSTALLSNMILKIYIWCCYSEQSPWLRRPPGRLCCPFLLPCNTLLYCAVWISNKVKNKDISGSPSWEQATKRRLSQEKQGHVVNSNGLKVLLHAVMGGNISQPICHVAEAQL